MYRDRGCASGFNRNDCSTDATSCINAASKKGVMDAVNRLVVTEVNRFMSLHIERINAATPSSEIEALYDIHKNSQYSPWSFSTFKDCFTPPYYGLVARQNGSVIGYAIILQVLDEATLMDIAVKSNCRGIGVGQRLIETLFDIAIEKNTKEIWLEVRESNTSATSLYKKNGFEIIETRKNYYSCEEGKEHASIMRWSQ